MASRPHRLEPAPPPPGESTQCPRCGARLESPLRLQACGSCGAGILREGAEVFDVAAFPRTVEAVDVPRLLADALRARQSPRHRRLLEIHRVELPYWLVPPGELVAAFPTVIDEARRLPEPAAEALPASLSRVPAVRAEVLEQRPLRLVLLPGFDVRYEVRGRAFHALIDAHRGRVLGDLYPHPFTVRVHVLMAAVLAVDVAAFATAAYLSPNNLVRTFAVAALAFPVYAVTAAAFRLRER